MPETVFLLLPLYDQTCMRTRLINFFSHFAGWVLFFSLILAFLSGPPGGRRSISSILFSWPFLIFSLTYLLLFYLNLGILVPKLYLQKKYALYFGLIILLFGAVYLLKPFDRMISTQREIGNRIPAEPDLRGPAEFQMPPGEKGPGPRGGHPVNWDINSIILFVTIWSISFSIPLIRQWRLTEKRVLQAESDKANAELSFLKAQINPHFLFNTLNNIYSMAVTGHEQTAPSILRLSGIMRYITSEIGQNFVALEDEVQCMQDYIGLQKMRLGQNTQLELQIEGNLTGRQIPPLLLMTFVENVFKYGTSSHEPSRILISLKTDPKTIHFKTVNPLFRREPGSDSKGIGIANARERLQLLYPGKHQLDISTGDDQFRVELILQL